VERPNETWVGKNLEGVYISLIKRTTLALNRTSLSSGYDF